MARYGYAWAMLSPTARGSRRERARAGARDDRRRGLLHAGHLGMKAYAGTFAPAGERSDAEHGGEAGDAARRRRRRGRGRRRSSTFQSWPQWVNFVIIASFVLFRPLVILGAIFYFATRKRREVSITGTMLRGSTGAWYLYDADLLGNVAES